MLSNKKTGGLIFYIKVLDDFFVPDIQFRDEKIHHQTLIAQDIILVGTCVLVLYTIQLMVKS